MHLQRVARLTGLLYALNFVLGITAMVWSSHGHAVAADRMTLAGAIEYALVVLLIAWLFEGAGRAFSWTVAAIGLAGCAVGVAGALHLWGSATSALPVFGLYCIGLGALVVRSGLMPQLIGALLAIGGICWLTYADLALARGLQPYNMACGIIAEMIFALWLIGVGFRHGKAAASA
jgi:uncharacterized protein DUF4386